MHISERLRAAEEAGRPSISFEFFPPKTAQGVQNLYDRMDRMHDLGPTFIDVTWGAGGRHSGLTCEMVKVAQSVYGLETCMHLTCTDMEKSKIDDALKEAYNSGCTNILALRGDPPRENEKWVASQGGFQYARDLVKYIRSQYGDHFDIGVAGYSEGCDDNKNTDELIRHLKEKVDAGGTFVITQMFYDTDIFLDWLRKVREAGITVPIIPGIMPIHTYGAFIRRANWTECNVPKAWMEALEPVKNDDAAVRDVGRELIVEMCKRLLAGGINHLHFYTMNLAQATRMVLEDLNLVPDLESPLEKPLPWRPSKGLKRREENVRPIFWRNRNRSYVVRTQDWDEFPNGRWGDSRSPAFGELDAYGIGLKGTNEANVKLWGEPSTIRDISNLFVKYMQGKLDHLPWSENPLSLESDVLRGELVDLNTRGIFTINSQPPVDGEKSTHPVYGWGPRNGYVFQKAYLESFVSPEMISELITRIERNPDMTYYAVNKAGELKTNAPGDGPNAVTWGVFPGKEIVQPTIVETVSFLAWKDEFYRLGQDWANCYSATNQSRYVIEDMMDTYYLVNIVHNDFRKTEGIFPLFDGLGLQDMEKLIHAVDKGIATVDGVSDTLTNGDVKGQPNGHPPALANGVR
ncbi:methylenetetrahydrofolate reduct [Eremomyces bilateralis CBS 781.70]|uniref:Methylenetetrahydrofolate reduct n=1 Tax=Eremomyces bilateralis CBS 781.70 TaxID=1392243 RepID=A0A6G1G1T1_9PEZI|nr:methylenetetrahydrofolate reduct [Eremomyces bilateralis CBS 781.70]KAF1812067.1 methylenetetrahydrofolate reduct [Eremomyces bilateralis CBS 781.70]